MTRATVALRLAALIAARQGVDARTAQWLACTPGTPAEDDATFMLRLALRSEAYDAEYYMDALADLAHKK